MSIFAHSEHLAQLGYVPDQAQAVKVGDLLFVEHSPGEDARVTHVFSGEFREPGEPTILLVAMYRGEQYVGVYGECEQVFIKA